MREWRVRFVAGSWSKLELGGDGGECGLLWLRCCGFGKRREDKEKKLT